MNTKRQAAETETKNDLVKTVEHLLMDIHDESLDKDRPGSETVSRTMSRFAALLVILSRQADEATRANIKLQETVVRLTWGLFWLTLALTFVGAVQLYSLIK